MFCVACMIVAHDFAVRFAIALLFMSRKENLQNKYNGICVLARFAFANMDCICCFLACMRFAYDGAVECAVALLFSSKNNKVQKV